MNKWQRIKDKIYREKLDIIGGLFNEISKNVNSRSLPRDRWTAPLENWASDQIKEQSSFRLSLQEYNNLKRLVEDLDQNFVWQYGNENQVITEFYQEFTNDYLLMLESRENAIKLEITAELIEEKQFPLEIFGEWYGQHWTLPTDQFDEALGDFWGDVWRHAAGGAGIGAAAGGAAGLPAGGIGSFAGAGIGGALGGLTGGAYGFGKHLLRRVWDYRQKQTNFEQTKEKAIEALKKLKDLSKSFEMHPNFLTSLDTMINQLGATKAYRLGGSQQTHQDSSPMAVNAMNQPVPQPETIPQQPETIPQQPETLVEPEAIPAEVKKKRQLSPEHISKMHMAKVRKHGFNAGKGNGPERSLEDFKGNTQEYETWIQAYREGQKEKNNINSPDDIADIYRKAYNNGEYKPLFAMGAALDAINIKKPEDIKSSNDMIKFKDQFDHYLKTAPEDSKTHKEVQTAKDFVDALDVQEKTNNLAANKGIEQAGDAHQLTPSTKEEPIQEEEPIQKDWDEPNPNISNIAPKLDNDGNPIGEEDAEKLKRLQEMSSKEFREYIRARGFKNYEDNGGPFEQVGPPSIAKNSTRKWAITFLSYAEITRDKYNAEKQESIVQKYKKMLRENKKIFPRYKIESLSVKDKIECVKNLLRG